MEKTKRRLVRLVAEQIEQIGLKLDELADLTIEERPFLEGGALVYRYQPSKRNELNIELDSLILGVRSTWNQIKSINN